MGRSDEEKDFHSSFPEKNLLTREKKLFTRALHGITRAKIEETIYLPMHQEPRKIEALSVCLFTHSTPRCVFRGGERARRWKTEARDVKLPSHSPLRRTCCILKQIRTTLLSQTKHKAASGVRQWFVLQREEIKTSIH